MNDCCPTDVELGSGDKAMVGRINASVMEKIGAAKPKRRNGRIVRTLLLAAVIAAMMGTVAYAANAYFMNMEKVDEGVSGRWYLEDENGKVLEDQKISFPDAGMVLSFDGPAETSNQPEFRCWYLPSEADFGYTDAEGWATYLSDQGRDADIPYIVSAGVVRNNHRTVINGEVTVAKEEDWDDWHVIELTSDYTGCTLRWAYDKASFVLLFNGEKGWLVQVTGTSDLETLEHIARELEIRDSGERPYHEESYYAEGIGQIDPGRG